MTEEEQTQIDALQTRAADLQRLVNGYESFLHLLQLHAEVCLDHEKASRLVSNACSWSYAHRRGNGEPTEEEQQAMVDKAFDRLQSFD